MQKNQAIFVVGSPGSGKDVFIKDMTSNYNILEFTSSQISEMLSDDAAFKRAKTEKKNSLLYRESIVINCKSYELDFITNKDILEYVGYSTHLVLVEANMKVSYERVKNRNVKESLERISQGNNNRNSILEIFESKIIVDNSETLNLTESREFINTILDDLVFKSDLTLESVVKDKSLKKKLKSKIVPDDRFNSDAGNLNFMFTAYESIDSPDSLSSLSSISTTNGSNDYDNGKRFATRETLKKVNSGLKIKKTYPKGI